MSEIPFENYIIDSESSKLTDANTQNYSRNVFKSEHINTRIADANELSVDDEGVSNDPSEDVESDVAKVDQRWKINSEIIVEPERKDK